MGHHRPRSEPNFVAYGNFFCSVWGIYCIRYINGYSARNLDSIKMLQIRRRD
jgi:hypothetical protein